VPALRRVRGLGERLAAGGVWGGDMASQGEMASQQALLARVQALDSAHALEVCGWLLRQVRVRRLGLRARRTAAAS
jgi:hypothetical protein